jgi:hypothetical protein
MVPFSCFLSAVESRTCALPDIVPLSRQLLPIVRNILPLITTISMREIFHEFHIQFLARLMVNNGEAAIAADTRTLQGRQELLEMERGYSTHGAGEPMPNALIDLKLFMKGAVDFNSAIGRACESVRCSVAFLISDDFPESTSTASVLTDQPYTMTLSLMKIRQLRIYIENCWFISLKCRRKNVWDSIRITRHGKLVATESPSWREGLNLILRR